MAIAAYGASQNSFISSACLRIVRDIVGKCGVRQQYVSLRRLACSLIEIARRY